MGNPQQKTKEAGVFAKEAASKTGEAIKEAATDVKEKVGQKVEETKKGSKEKMPQAAGPQSTPRR
jgi:hypothetical protein